MTFRQIEPQPARGVLQEFMWDSPEWIAEEKYDGDRRIAQFCGNVVRFTGRRKSVSDGLYVEKTANVPQLSGKWHDHAVAMSCGWKPPPSWLDGTVLDGEMICTLHETVGSSESRSKFVTSIMGSLPEEAVRKQIERGWLRYVVFDCLFYKGKDVRGLAYYERKEMSITAVTTWANPYAVAAPHTGVKKRLFLAKVLECGGEGVILKNLDHVYGDKKGWVKVKAEWTADVVIVGFKDAKEISKKVDGSESMTKYAKAGLIGAVVCGQYISGVDEACGSMQRSERLVEVATVSGMDDTLRRMLTLKPEIYIGKVMEIAHNGREPTGRFRHPRFKRFRDDKAAKDCVYREGEI